VISAITGSRMLVSALRGLVSSPGWLAAGSRLLQGAGAGSAVRQASSHAENTNTFLREVRRKLYLGSSFICSIGGIGRLRAVAAGRSDSAPRPYSSGPGPAGVPRAPAEAPADSKPRDGGGAGASEGQWCAARARVWGLRGAVVHQPPAVTLARAPSATATQPPPIPYTPSAPVPPGEIEVYNAYRVQHNNSRGPFKGGLRYHPAVDLDDVRRCISSEGVDERGWRVVCVLVG
jgi:hypothetical protein